MKKSRLTEIILEEIGQMFSTSGMVPLPKSNGDEQIADLPGDVDENHYDEKPHWVNVKKSETNKIKTTRDLMAMIKSFINNKNTNNYPIKLFLFDRVYKLDGTLSAMLQSVIDSDGYTVSSIGTNPTRNDSTKVFSINLQLDQPMSRDYVNAVRSAGSLD